jgi:hypothetical protein
MLWPVTVTVIFHDTIDTTAMKKTEVSQLRDRVRQIIAEPVESRLRNTEEADSDAEKNEDRVIT